MTRIACCTLLMMTATASGQVNPVFLIGSPRHSTVKYEEFPGALRKVCGAAFARAHEHHVDPISIFAKVRVGDSDFFAVADSGPPSEYYAGELIQIRGTHCNLSDLDAALSSVPGMPAHEICVDSDCALRSQAEEDALRSLVRDAIRRAVDAYGSDASFRKVACKTEVGVTLAEPGGYPIVAEELKSYCSGAAVKGGSRAPATP